MPTLQPAREQDDERLIRTRPARPFDRAVEDGELLAEQGSFDDQLRLAAGQVMDAPHSERRDGQLGPRPKTVVEHQHASRDQLPHPVQ
ncbi:MAG: hypothetical protein M3380_20040 [Chloroflexota bacterium]|nr:hypothetical protein [Chloroflexota bacterium]